MLVGIQSQRVYQRNRSERCKIKSYPHPRGRYAQTHRRVRAVASSSGTTALIGKAPRYFSPFRRNHVGVDVAPSFLPSATSWSTGFWQPGEAVGWMSLSMRSFHALARSFEHHTDFVCCTDSGFTTG